MVLIFAEVHPFGSVTAEPIAVDIVSPAEVAPPPKETKNRRPKRSLRTPLIFLRNLRLQVPRHLPPYRRQRRRRKSRRRCRRRGPIGNRQQAAAQPQPPSTSPSPAYTPPEPDLSIKYHVMLGPAPDLPPSLPQARSGDPFDAPASKAADIASSLVTEFRRHLKTCSKLPASIAPSDKIRITLRVFMTLEGKLAAEPDC